MIGSIIYHAFKGFQVNQISEFPGAEPMTEQWNCVVWSVCCCYVMMCRESLQSINERSCSSAVATVSDAHARIAATLRSYINAAPRPEETQLFDATLGALRKRSEEPEYPVTLSIAALVSTHTSLIGRRKHGEYWVQSIWQLSEMWEKKSICSQKAGKVTKRDGGSLQTHEPASTAERKSKSLKSAFPSLTDTDSAKETHVCFSLLLKSFSSFMANLKMLYITLHKGSFQENKGRK